MRNVQYRGISGAIRRGIVSGKLCGIILPQQIRQQLPPEKQSAPDEVIIKSMKSLEKKGEIKFHDGKFCTRAYYRNKVANHSPKPAEKEYSLVGQLVDTKVVNGKQVMTFEVSSFMMK